MNGLSPREVLQDTTLNVKGQHYAVHKGDIVFISMPNVHKNPEIYDAPSEYRLKRFVYMHGKDGSRQVVTKGGVTVRTPYIWWGGGLHMVRSLLGVY